MSRAGSLGYPAQGHRLPAGRVQELQQPDGGGGGLGADQQGRLRGERAGPHVGVLHSVYLTIHTARFFPQVC